MDKMGKLTLQWSYIFIHTSLESLSTLYKFELKYLFVTLGGENVNSSFACCVIPFCGLLQVDELRFSKLVILCMAVKKQTFSFG